MSQNKDIECVGMSIMPTKNGIKFFVNNQEQPLSSLPEHIKLVIDRVTMTKDHTPEVIKFEMLTPKQFLILGLDLPVLPAVTDLKNKEDLETVAREDYAAVVNQRLSTLSPEQLGALYDERVAEYINYIQHELAGTYIKNMISGNPAVANKIARLDLMKDFELREFSFSTTGRNVYKVPQILPFKMTVGDETIIREYYMGLQEAIPQEQKDEKFWDTVSFRDVNYLQLDAGLNSAISSIKEKYGDISFLGPETSTLYTSQKQ